MFPYFLPSSVIEIQDAEAIAALQHIQRLVVQVPFQQVHDAHTRGSVAAFYVAINDALLNALIAALVDHTAII